MYYFIDVLFEMRYLTDAALLCITYDVMYYRFTTRDVL